MPAAPDAHSVRSDHLKFALRDETTKAIRLRNLTRDQAAQLRDDLREKGHRFEVVTDTEE